MVRPSRGDRLEGDSTRTRIKELRARSDLTQDDLAKLVGVRRETILFLEKGKYNPSLQLAYKIAKVFGMPMEEVFLMEDGEDSIPKQTIGTGKEE